MAGANTYDSGTMAAWESRGRGDVTVVRFDFACWLNGGDYLISVGVAESGPAGVVPLDRRYDAIHLQVANSRKVFGLVDLDMTAVATHVVAATGEWRGSGAPRAPMKVVGS